MGFIDRGYPDGSEMGTGQLDSKELLKLKFKENNGKYMVIITTCVRKLWKVI